ncbi:TetR/AcrR family transcriptional regulator [Rhodococcoides fascians A25f]|uniref:TetR/AcrR family transcriptional regulator n=1 Tax=Rhodococcoides fascians TaxID=1828 RepID=UPI00055D5512|nr:TetR/AcrR family transcriptional regulator [Rhodococcus fascians]QII07343.1 TetR/AcrR family transcriptional regulator [Rhodococcus fascians A25f]
MSSATDRPLPTTPVISGGSRLRRVAKPDRQASYDNEVRQLVLATQQVMLRIGRADRPRVADIVREAGMSNQAFYRHFRSRDDVIVATYEQGLLAIHSYLERKVLEQVGLEARMRAWIDGVLAQIEDPALSQLSATIIWNVGQVAPNNSDIEPVGHARILDLLTAVMTEGHVAQPFRTAQLIHTLVMGTTATYLNSGERPTPEDREHLLVFCMAGMALQH